MYMVFIQVLKFVFLGRVSKYRSLQEIDNGQYSGIFIIEYIYYFRVNKKYFLFKEKVRLCVFVSICYFKFFIQKNFRIILKVEKMFNKFFCINFLVL